MSRPRGDEASLYERHAQRLRQSVARALGADHRHAEDGCAFAWAQLCRTQPERGEQLFSWLRTTAIREAWRLAQRERRESAPAASLDDTACHPAWEDLVPTPETLERALDGREATELLTSLPGREARYLTLFAAGYTYHEIAEREGVTYTNVNKPLARASRRAQALGKGAKHPAAAVRES